MKTGMKTGLYDKNGKEISFGDKVKLILDDGEERIFDVCYKTVGPKVVSHPNFKEKYAKVSITGVVFCWEGYDLFPCVDSEGIPDNQKMEIVEEATEETECWEMEAKKHAAEAGELKIAIAEKLDEVRGRISKVTKEIEKASDITAVVTAKAERSELEKQSQWLEKILYGGAG